MTLPKRRRSILDLQVHNSPFGRDGEQEEGALVLLVNVLLDREQGLQHFYSLLTHLKQAPVTKGAGRRIKIPPTCSLGGQGQK